MTLPAPATTPRALGSLRSLRSTLFVCLLAGLVTGLGGAFATPSLDLDRAATADPASPPTPGALDVDTAPPTSVPPAPLGLKTGDTVDEAQLDAFRARVAWLQEQGLHRGAAVYVHA